LKDRGTFVIFIVLILLAGVLLVKSFLPTSFLASKPSVSDDKIKLRLSGYGGYLEEEYMKDIKYEFEEMYPHVEVVLEISPTSYEDMQFKTGFIPGYEQHILADFAAKDAPDVFYVPQGRSSLYIDAEALLDLQPFLFEKYGNAMAKETYTINRGSINLGVSSQTDHPYEAFLLIDFINNHYQKTLDSIREKAITKASAFLLPDSGLESKEAFEDAWNAFAVAMNRNDLILWKLPEQVSNYWGFRMPNEPYDYMYIQLTSNSFSNQIKSAIISLEAHYGDNQKVIQNFKTAIEIFIRAVDPTLTSEEVAQIIADLGFDMANFDLLPFHMVGSVYYNGYEYSTEATAIDIELTRKKEFYKIDLWLAYRLRVKKQDMLRMPYRKYPK